MQALVGRRCCSREVVLVVEEEVVVVVFSLVLAGVGSEELLEEAWMRQNEFGGFPLLTLERLAEKTSCCVAGDELGRLAGLQEE